MTPGFTPWSSIQALPSVDNPKSMPASGFFLMSPAPQQEAGSLHCTPEHCLVKWSCKWSFPCSLVERAMFQTGKMYLVRSPEKRTRICPQVGVAKNPQVPKSARGIQPKPANLGWFLGGDSCIHQSVAPPNGGLLAGGKGFSSKI